MRISAEFSAGNVIFVSLTVNHLSLRPALRKNGRFYTRGRIIRLDELGQTFVVGRIMRL